jgi:hypothetical protein
LGILQRWYQPKRRGPAGRKAMPGRRKVCNFTINFHISYFQYCVECSSGSMIRIFMTPLEFTLLTLEYIFQHSLYCFSYSHLSTETWMISRSLGSLQWTGRQCTNHGWIYIFENLLHRITS